MLKNLRERLDKAMEENKKTDEIALKTLGFNSVDEFIKSKVLA